MGFIHVLNCFITFSSSAPSFIFFSNYLLSSYSASGAEIDPWDKQQKTNKQKQKKKKSFFKRAKLTRKSSNQRFPKYSSHACQKGRTRLLPLLEVFNYYNLLLTFPHPTSIHIFWDSDVRATLLYLVCVKNVKIWIFSSKLSAWYCVYSMLLFRNWYISISFSLLSERYHQFFWYLWYLWYCLMLTPFFFI